MLVFASMPHMVSANDNITVTIDGQVVAFTDQQPVIVDGRTLVPVGGVFGAIDFVPTWDGATQTATLIRDDFTVVITIGNATFTTNDVQHTLDVPAQIIGGRTMLPIRAVLESVGYNLDWNSATRTVVIISPATEAPPAPPITTPSEPTPPAEEPTRGEPEDTPTDYVSDNDFIPPAYMDAIREFLGVDFTVDATEHSNVGFTWHFLNLSEEIDVEEFRCWEFEFRGLPGHMSGSNVLPRNAMSQTGDVLFVRNSQGMPQLWIDLGACEFDPHTHRIYTHINISAAVEIVDFESYFDLDVIAEFFPDTNRVWIDDEEYRYDSWNGNVWQWRHLRFEGTMVFEDLEHNGHGNAFNTQTGDIILVLRNGRPPQLLIDLGSSIEVMGTSVGWTEQHRAYRVVYL